MILGLAALLLFTQATARRALGADRPTIPDYTVGAVAETNLVTPVPLDVFDPARTEALRQSEAEKLPPFFQFLPSESDQAQEDLRRAFGSARTDLVGTLQKTFGHSVPLLSAEVAQPRFTGAVQEFRRRRPDFPLGTRLVELWAFGDSGDTAMEDLLGRLRRFTNSLMRADSLPAGEHMAASTVRLIESRSTAHAPPLDLAAAEKESRTLGWTDLPTVSQARDAGLAGMSGEEKAALAFALTFLRPNCVFDPALTHQARLRHAVGLSVTDHYAAGQAVVKQGDVITARVKVALDALRLRGDADRAEAVAAQERAGRTRAETAMTAARQAADSARRANRWLVAGLVAVGALSLLIGWRWWRARSFTSPARMDPHLAVVSTGPCASRNDGDEETDWRARALVAEARAEKAAALLRANLFPHLARWMMNELVGRLLSQRSDMLSSHRKAEQEVANLAERLDELHAPLEERLRAYEKRVAELEQELAAKGEQNVESIKAKIESTRKKLEAERGQKPLNWN